MQSLREDKAENPRTWNLSFALTIAVLGSQQRVLGSLGSAVLFSTNRVWPPLRHLHKDCTAMLSAAEERTSKAMFCIRLSSTLQICLVTRSSTEEVLVTGAAHRRVSSVEPLQYARSRSTCQYNEHISVLRSRLPLFCA